MTRIAHLTLIAALVASIGAVAWAATGADTAAADGFGNQTLTGSYEFYAQGVIEVNGLPTRGIWEIGRFDADGKGNITNGVEYSTLLGDAESTIDQYFTFSGTYNVHTDGITTGEVTVITPVGPIVKRLWLIVHSVGKDGIANGFDGGHAHADLGPGGHGNTLSHVGHRIEIAK
jgi:hypothetical protein